MLSFAHLQGSVILYEEIFSHPSEVPANNNNVRVPASIGWTSYFGSTGTNITSNTGAQKSSVLIAWTAGSPHVDGPGYIYSREDHQSGFSDRNISMLSPEFLNAWDPAAGAIEVSFRGNQSHRAIAVHFMAKIDGQWYVRNEDFLLVVGTQNSIREPDLENVSSLSRSFELDLNGDQWSSLNFVEGETMMRGSVGSGMLSGTISQVGFFVVNPVTSTSGTTYIARLDSLMITQVPEPSRMIYLFGGGLIWLFLSRRRP